MNSVGFSVSYINTYLCGEDENNPKNVSVGYFETIVNTNEAHQQCKRVVNEKNTRSQGSSQKCGTPKSNPQIMIREQKKSVSENSDDGDDHNPPKKILERPHKLTISGKRKRQVNQ
jgi:hypothetical protein